MLLLDLTLKKKLFKKLKDQYLIDLGQAYMLILQV